MEIVRRAASAVLVMVGAAKEATAPTGFEPGPMGEAFLEHLAKGLSDAAVGEWASYELTRTDGRTSHWRLAAVGEETDERGRPAIWIEMEVGDHAELAAPLAQIRMLVAKRSGSKADAIARLIVAVGADRPQEVPPHSLGALRRELRAVRWSTDAEHPDGMAIHSGQESAVMTGAGTIRSIPIEILRAGTVIQRIWISRRVPLLHLSKLEVPAIGYSMVVTAFGRDAAPRISLPGARSKGIAVERIGRNRADAGQEE